MTREIGNRVAAFGCFILGVVIIFIIVTLPGCGGTRMPPIDVSFWAGDSAKDGISRSQENRTLECKDPAFENYTCLTYEDLQKIYDTMLECKQWPMLASTRQLRTFVRKNSEVIQHVLSTKRSQKAAQSYQR